MSILDKIKLKLGISHNAKDEAILDDIQTARTEMIRAGVPDVVAMDNDPLVRRAVETYVLMEHGDQSLRDKYQEAFDNQVNNLRKSGGRWGDV